MCAKYIVNVGVVSDRYIDIFLSSLGILTCNWGCKTVSSFKKWYLIQNNYNIIIIIITIIVIIA